MQWAAIIHLQLSSRSQSMSLRHSGDYVSYTAHVKLPCSDHAHQYNDPHPCDRPHSPQNWNWLTRCKLSWVTTNASSPNRKCSSQRSSCLFAHLVRFSKLNTSTAQPIMESKFRSSRYSLTAHTWARSLETKFKRSPPARSSLQLHAAYHKSSTSFRSKHMTMRARIWCYWRI